LRYTLGVNKKEKEWKNESEKEMVLVVDGCDVVVVGFPTDTLSLCE